MKRIGNLYKKAFTPAALISAFHAAAYSKRGKRSCFEFERRIATNLCDLHRELHLGTYQVQPYYSFMVYEPKPRMVYAPAFRDLVVQHAIYAVVNPIFNRTFIDQSFACRIGKGTHAAANYAQQALRASSPKSYTLKIDIRRFFYSIDRTILLSLIERKIKDSRLVDLMMLFAKYDDPLGIPIGNLLSQLYALIYLNPMDHYIKRVLKIRKYCRYVDDGVLFGLSRAECIRARKQIEVFIRDNLHLEYSRTTIAGRRKGVNFVGYRTWAGKRFIRKHSLYNFRLALKKRNIESLVSLVGHARRTSSLRHMLQQIPKEIKHENHCLQKICRQINHKNTAFAH